MNTFSVHGSRRALRGSGFTLIEVIVTLTVFIILTSSVFGIMTAVFQSSDALKSNQNRRDEVSALRAYLKNNLENLGATDRFATYSRGMEDGLRINGILLITQGQTEAVDATRQANGLYTLRLAQPGGDDPPPSVRSFTQELERNEGALAWTPLIRDVRFITWRFQQPPSPTWMEEWTDDRMKPGLIECTIQLAGDEQPTAMDFLIPHLAVSPTQTLTEVATHAP